jgi:hypothetical protein
MKTIIIKNSFELGMEIHEACRSAVAKAIEENCCVQFDFNDQTLTATPQISPDKLAQSFLDECERRHQAWIKSDAYKEQCREAEAAQKRKDAELAAALETAPKSMTLHDESAWKKCREKNTDPYGGAVIEYAERWARLMEGRLAAGDTIEKCANAMSHWADNDGITGFMYGCAVSILSKVWIHGEQLRRWHNLKTQLRDEGEKANQTGGVLNPALLCIGKP